jgi:hypothetical protein
VVGWIIGCGGCDNAAVARMPLDEARRAAYRHGWQRRQHGQRRRWVCPSCAGVPLPTQPRSRIGAERKAS